MARAIDPDHAERTIRVFENAAKKIPDDTEGEMNPRVLGRVVDEVEWADDTVLVDYLGGILASAKTPEGRDDRGVMWTRVVGGLSTYALRLHYIIYTVAREAYPGRVESITDGTKLGANARLFIPFGVIVAAMDFSEEELRDRDRLVGHAGLALQSADLIRQFVLGHVDMLRAGHVPYATQDGLAVSPTPRGVELYMWAHGHGVKSLNDFLQATLAFESPPEIVIPFGAQLVNDMRAVDASSTDVSEGPAPG